MNVAVTIVQEVVILFLRRFADLRYRSFWAGLPDKANNQLDHRNQVKKFIFSDLDNYLTILSIEILERVEHWTHFFNISARDSARSIRNKPYFINSLCN